MSSDRPNVPLLKYPGHKHTLARQIAAFIPGHDCYTEPYCGGAAVLFAKPRSRMETINDLSGEVYNFLTVLRCQRDELIEAIKWTPWAAAEHVLCLQPTGDPLERARRFYFRCWASIRPFDNNPSFRRQYVISRGRDGNSGAMTAAAAQFTRIEHLHWYAERLRGVVIENLPALEFIERYDNPAAVCYFDPPYLDEVRGNTAIYDEEMPGEAEHRELADTLHQLQGMALISGYACPLYTELYEDRGWRRVEFSARIDGGGSAVECLWLSPRTVAALEAEKQQQQRERLPLLHLMSAL